MVGLVKFSYHKFLLYTKAPWRKESIVRLDEFPFGKIRCNTRYEAERIKEILTKEEVIFSEKILYSQEDNDRKRRISPMSFEEIFSGQRNSWADIGFNESIDLWTVRRALKSQKGFWVVREKKGGFYILQ